MFVEVDMFQFDVYATLVAATLVLLLGRQCAQHSLLLKKYAIPEPIIGGLLIALLLLVLYLTVGWVFTFDASLRDPLMLTFFASIGLNANLARLKDGGSVLVKFIVVVIGLLILQNAIGIGMANMLGLNPLMGLLAGTVTLSGGHGTGAAWSAVFVDKYGVMNATEVAMACATFGLVLGGVIAGPVALYLLKHSATSTGAADDAVQLSTFEKPDSGRMITALVLVESIAMIAICLLIGRQLSAWLSGTMFDLPIFVYVLFAGVLLSNILACIGFYQVFERAVSIMGNVSLSLFLCMALMSLKLWELASLALPMLAILMAQTLAMVLYTIFVTYRVMGSNYDAAILAAGHCGLGLGATPTAIANMQAITHRLGPSPIAFLIVPMVGAFFLDIANAVVIKMSLLLPLFTALVK